MESMHIGIAHFLPDLLNLYGDHGNVFCLQKRLLWRGISASVTQYRLGDELNIDEADIIFMGGGSDREQKIATTRLLDYKEVLKTYVEKDGVLLAICGGYQLIGHYYQAGEEEIRGLSLIDAYTVSGNKRLVGNIVLQCDSPRLQTKLVGFENHSGRTHIGDHTPLGKVARGFGNNGEDGIEGIIYKNVIGTYLHGPVLPKNPVLSDYILQKALERKYGSDVEMPPLDDEAESRTHDYLVQRFS